jgi:hypothetical protein
MSARRLVLVQSVQLPDKKGKKNADGMWRSNLEAGESALPATLPLAQLRAGNLDERSIG